MSFNDTRDLRAPLAEPPADVDALASAVIDAAIEVHRLLGPGYQEAVYEQALARELTRRGIPFVRQLPIAVRYKGEVVGDARIDLLVADKLVVELKASDGLPSLHVAQAVSYLRATDLPLALVINFGGPVLLRGVRRVVRGTR